jgi:predicted DNA-binding transcriptional regulator AlpA
MAVQTSRVNSSSVHQQCTTSEPDRCLSERQVAALLGVSIAALRKWRRVGGGPPYLRIGKLIRYRFSDLQNFMDLCAVDPNAGGQQ